MNPVDNPYTPNAGARPQALVGRDELLDDFRTLVGRIQRGSTDKGLLITGLRGVGKTVLLNEFRQIASSDSTVVRLMEVSKFVEGFTLKKAFVSKPLRALLSEKQVESPCFFAMIILFRKSPAPKDNNPSHPTRGIARTGASSYIERVKTYKNKS